MIQEAFPSQQPSAPISSCFHTASQFTQTWLRTFQQPSVRLDEVIRQSSKTLDVHFRPTAVSSYRRISLTSVLASRSSVPRVASVLFRLFSVATSSPSPVSEPSKLSSLVQPSTRVLKRSRPRSLMMALRSEFRPFESSVHSPYAQRFKRSRSHSALTVFEGSRFVSANLSSLSEIPGHVRPPLLDFPVTSKTFLHSASIVRKIGSRRHAPR